MMTKVETTTERPRLPRHDQARPARSGFSVRTRIAAAVAVLVAFAMAGAGLLVYVIETERIKDKTVNEVDQEIAEFQRLQAEGIDPATGERFTELESLLRTFMERNVPDDDELLVGWLEDEPVVWFPDDPLVQDAEFLETTRELIPDGRSAELDTAAGAVLINTQPVRRGTAQGALVVVNYLDEDRAELSDTMRTYAVVAALSLLIVTAVAFWQAGRLLRPLRTLRTTAEEIGETDLSRRLPVAGNDDITALTRTVNGMLERLDEAFAGQRQFLDDAGHELRTPLTVLRGHLELLDTGSPEEIVATRDLLLDEVDRMSRLVGDLILLAKSDRPDFLNPGWCVPADLTASVLAKARALGDRAWTLGPTTAQPAWMDEQRITQALLALADNAVKHTQVGDLIEIGSAYAGDRLRLWVRDTGPGVPEQDRQLIFERFGRSTVRSDDEGFGLGLSIVSAIARAHGGSATLESPGDGGARFVVTLPVRPSVTMGQG
jgi:signal transduction histidine kinase